MKERTHELEDDYLLDLYEEDRDFEIKKWLLEYSVKLIHDLFYYRSSSDKYAFMNKEFEVTPKNIIDCIKNQIKIME